VVIAHSFFYKLKYRSLTSRNCFSRVTIVLKTRHKIVTNCVTDIYIYFSEIFRILIFSYIECFSEIYQLDCVSE